MRASARVSSKASRGDLVRHQAYRRFTTLAMRGGGGGRRVHTKGVWLKSGWWMVVQRTNSNNVTHQLPEESNLEKDAENGFEEAEEGRGWVLRMWLLSRGLRRVLVVVVLLVRLRHGQRNSGLFVELAHDCWRGVGRFAHASGRAGSGGGLRHRLIVHVVGCDSSKQPEVKSKW